MKEITEKTKSESTLKHILVLLARIFAILFLVLAFSQPYIPAKNAVSKNANRLVSVFIDNSFSMEAINKNGTLLDDAKTQALEIAAAYNPTDRFQLLTNDFEGRHQRLVSKEEFINLVKEVKISPSTRLLSEIASRQADVLHKETETVQNHSVSYIISDFQESNSDFEKIKNDTSITFNLVSISSAETNNIFIDTCWFETPVRRFDQIEKLHVVIKNNSNKDLENNSIKLFINGLQKTPADFSVEKNATTEVVLSFVIKENEFRNTNLTQNQNVLIHGNIELTDHPITFDDKFYFNYEIKKNIQVLCINSTPLGSPYINKLFANDSVFLFKNMNEKNIDYAEFSNNQLIILNELNSISSGLSKELSRFVSQGGSLLLFPSANADLNTYNDFLSSVNSNILIKLDTASTKIDKINLENAIYNDVFDKSIFKNENLNLPLVNKHYSLSKSVKIAEDYLLKLQNGEVYLSQLQVNKGNLFLCASPLQIENGNFAKHSLFVPTLYKIAISSGSNQPLFYTINKNETISINDNSNKENIYHIQSVSGDFDVVPELTNMANSTVLKLHNQIVNSGNYNLTVSNLLIGGASFNFNRKESTTKYLDESKLKDEITNNNLLNFKSIKKESKSLTNQITEEEQGVKLWKFCIILALLFLGLEVFLIRFLKV